MYAEMYTEIHTNVAEIFFKLTNVIRIMSYLLNTTGSQQLLMLSAYCLHSFFPLSLQM